MSITFGDRACGMKTPSLDVRRAEMTDRDRILEISSRIWEGDDYVPETLDVWLTDREGELVVATLEGHVIAFAHRTWLCPGIAWFEGIRSDPEFQGRGAGRMLTDYLLDSARHDGASRIELSTYIDNEASIHIIESFGFRKVGTFSHLERPAGPAEPAAPSTQSIHVLSESETVRFVADSEFLALGGGRFPRGWRFFPFDHDPREATARLACRLAYVSGGRLVAVLCVRQDVDHEGEITLNFIDGAREGVRALLDHALTRYSGHAMECMLPVDEGRYPIALSSLVDAGFTSWNNFKPDVFAYELWL
jgi:RimJ/RimL family protein N-acetyltransferase